MAYALPVEALNKSFCERKDHRVVLQIISERHFEEWWKRVVNIDTRPKDTKSCC